ncbi:hypothetical protein PAAG_12516 [Paracoccidioides lutzii Pb01]|uniref:Fungal-type protein kinase domain-containing protein n=1 Tax=Paracoccidioides lutzii (strain ATCC MYA-826 / Pb01) TaxID=502779 RepID=A0A0A2UZ23_PARBA|nr:hypothetical protein PAAG_12516 [Paracoccidioides lutzii Pb01]KGQ00821.1 hypothetical protein PAAG_12516 [Paracoccidioides lutzii Pb01]
MTRGMFWWLKSSKSLEEIRIKDTLLQMGHYVCEVFYHPAHPAVHSRIRCLRDQDEEDNVIDTYKDSRQFFQVHVGYTMMSVEGLGLGILIARDEGGRKSITVRGPGTSEEVMLQLGEMLSFNVPSCFMGPRVVSQTRTGEGVAKLSWVSDKQHPEVELLKLAGQKNAQGVPRIIGHSTITSIADMGCDMAFDDKHHDFKSTRPNKGSQVSKQSHSINQPSRDTQEENEPTFSIQSAHKLSLFTRNGEELHDNCVLWCLIISPAGRAIYNYRSSLELLTALHDAIKVHRSLYLDGNILHQDISENDITITDPQMAEDLAKEVSSERSSAQHQTGTMEFIAIEVLLHIHMMSRSSTSLPGSVPVNGWEKLQQLRRSYISYMAGTGGFETHPNNEFSPPNNSLLRKWFTDSCRDTARFKRSDMGADGFEGIFHLSSPKYLSFAKTLCRAIRDILLPYGDRGIIVGTPQDQKRLFNPIIQAYDDAISLIGMSNDLITEGVGAIFIFVVEVCTFAMEYIILQLA